jgi:hypothetical protein
MCLVVTILFYLKFLKLYLSDRSVIEKVVENLPNPNGAGHLPNDSRFLLHPVLGRFRKKAALLYYVLPSVSRVEPTGPKNEMYWLYE